MEKMYTVNLKESELEMLLKIVRRSLGNTRDKQRRRQLGLLHDELDATLMMDMIKAAGRRLDELNLMLEQHKKAEKRKHLRVVSSN
jgi:hypothetical protein